MIGMISIPPWIFLTSIPVFLFCVFVILYSKFKLKTLKQVIRTLLIGLTIFGIMLVFIVVDLTLLQSEVVISLILYVPCMLIMFWYFYQLVKNMVSKVRMSLKILEIVTIINAAIEELQSSVEEITLTIVSIARKGNEINHMSEETKNLVSIIKKTADQAKLLSLNATIEAGRVGDQGRGFGIVANKFQEMSDDINNNTEGTTKTVERSLILIQELANDLESISAAMEEQNGSLSEISNSSAELMTHAEILRKLT